MSLNNFYSSSSAINNRKSANNQNVCFTLPITCQICLGKVKEPCVCPNLHAFCSFCIDIWLEKTKQCPTCRIPIDKENPCRRILGGIENMDDVDLLKPTEFSHPSTRKARYLNLLQQYEDEITRLNKYIDSLNDEVSKLKDAAKGVVAPSSGSSPQHDMIQMLKTKLQTVQNNYDEISKERDELREQNKKLDTENSILMQDLARLKATLNEKNSQITSKYTMAALESKCESYEKEIKQLQKALEKSDKYIAELEIKRDMKDKENSGFVSHSLNQIPSSSSSSSSSSCSNSSNLDKYTKTSNNYPTQLKFIKGDNQTFKNDLKIVKFSDKIDCLTSPPSSNLSTKKGVISNDKFYGSPSKTPVHIAPANSTTLPSVGSFSDRLKKNLFNTTLPNNSLDFEMPGSMSQSMITMNLPSNNHSANILLSSSSSNISNNNLNSNYNFISSPLKRLRLEQVSPDRIKYTQSVPKLEDHLNENDNLNASTSEFIDCIELLNRAEKKVQNRQMSPNKNELNYLNSNNNDKYYALLGTTQANPSLEPRSSNSSSSSSSGNSLAATITTGASSLMSSDSSSSCFNFNTSNRPGTGLKKFPSFEQNLNLAAYQPANSIYSNSPAVDTSTYLNNQINNHLANIKNTLNEFNNDSNLNINSSNTNFLSTNLNTSIGRSRSVEPVLRNLKS